MWENIKTVTYKGRKIWKKQMKSYYLKRKIKTIGKHINNVLKEELDNQVVVAKFTTVQLISSAVSWISSDSASKVRFCLLYFAKYFCAFS